MTYPSYCCQKCGEQIGWLGRLIGAALPDWHRCQFKKAMRPQEDN